jgi:hypothetical protein
MKCCMLATLVMLHACERPASEPEPIPAQLRCTHDEDCVLLPSTFTCCIECPPAPPYEAAASWVLDGMMIENETVCAEPRHLCLQVDCDPVPVGCIARAACVAGRCAVLEHDCELPAT